MCHDKVGGVTNSRFEIEVRSVLEADIPLLESQHVSGLLGDALDPTVKSFLKLRTLLPEEINTFRGILDWQEKDNLILAPTIYHKTQVVMRKITPTKMALVTDFPVCRTKRMIEAELRRLIDHGIPGKVIQSAIYFLTSWNTAIEVLSYVKKMLEEAGEDNEPLAKRSRKNQDKIGEIDIMDFDNDDEYPLNVGPSPKATKADDVGV